MTRFAYFTLRLRVPDATAGPAVSTGVVEDLATGEKHEFAGTRELLGLLGLEEDGRFKMQPDRGAGQSGPGEREP